MADWLAAACWLLMSAEVSEIYTNTHFLYSRESLNSVAVAAAAKEAADGTLVVNYAKAWLSEFYKI